MTAMPREAGIEALDDLDDPDVGEDGGGEALRAAASPVGA